MGCQLIQNYMGSSVGQRSQKPSPHSTTTCALSLNQTIRCQKRDLKLNFSQVRFNQLLGAVVWQVSNDTSITDVSSVLPQTKTSAQRKMVAVSMNASIHLGATAASAGVALCCTRISMTVKKVFCSNCSTLHKISVFVLGQYRNMQRLNDILLQPAVITLSIV